MFTIRSSLECRGRERHRFPGFSGRARVSALSAHVGYIELWPRLAMSEGRVGSVQASPGVRTRPWTLVNQGGRLVLERRRDAGWRLANKPQGPPVRLVDPSAGPEVVGVTYGRFCPQSMMC